MSIPILVLSRSDYDQIADTPEASRTYTSPSTHANSPPSSAPPPYEDEGQHAEDEKSEAHESTLTQATNSVAATAQYTYEELKDKLAKAEAALAAAYNDSASGLRQRNVKGSAEGDKKPVAELAQAVKHTVEGVPVQIVALLCLISFILAYLFF